MANHIDILDTYNEMFNEFKDKLIQLSRTNSLSESEIHNCVSDIKNIVLQLSSLNPLNTDFRNNLNEKNIDIDENGILHIID